MKWVMIWFGFWTASFVAAEAAVGRQSYTMALIPVEVTPLPVAWGPPRGSMQVTFETVAQATTVSWIVRWEGLTSLPTSAWVEGVPRDGGLGEVFFGLGRHFSDSSAAAGAYAGFRQLNDPGQREALMLGHARLVVATGVLSGGELTGMFQAIPEPFLFRWLLMAGLVGLGVRACRRCRNIVSA
jgi:hypothetical protein